MGMLNEEGVLVKHCGLTDGTNEVGLLEKFSQWRPGEEKTRGVLS